MPSRLTIVATLVLLVAAGRNALGLYRDGAAFDPARIGGDAVSLHLRKFARLRADLPTGAAVRCISDLRAGGAAEYAMFDLYAEALREHLATGSVEPRPGVDPALLRQIAAGYLADHPDAHSHDLATLRAVLIEWWAGLALDLQIVLTRLALAPHLVHKRGSMEFVVGDFPTSVDYSDLAAREGLTLVEDYGGGAVLFRSGR